MNHHCLGTFVKGTEKQQRQGGSKDLITRLPFWMPSVYGVGSKCLSRAQACLKYNISPILLITTAFLWAWLGVLGTENRSVGCLRSALSSLVMATCNLAWETGTWVILCQWRKCSLTNAVSGEVSSSMRMNINEKFISRDTFYSCSNSGWTTFFLP